MKIRACDISGYDMLGSVREKAILCEDMRVDHQATERDQLAPLVDSLPFVEPFLINSPKNIPKPVTSPECSHHKRDLC